MLATAKDDCERAYAYGIGAHEIQDSISHNYYVPDHLTSALFGIGIPNMIEHPLLEAAVEAKIMRDSPQTYAEMSRSLDILYTSRPELIQKTQDAILSSSGQVLDVKGLTSFLKEVIASPDGFYTKYFALPGLYQTFAEGNLYVGIVFLMIGGGLFFLNYLRMKKNKKWFSLAYLPILFILYLGYLFTFGGLAGTTNTSDANKYLQMSVDRTVDVFQPNGWNTRYQYDPTGFTALAQRDSQIYTNYLIGLILIGIIATLYIFVIRPRLKRR